MKPACILSTGCIQKRFIPCDIQVTECTQNVSTQGNQTVSLPSFYLHTVLNSSADPKGGNGIQCNFPKGIRFDTGSQIGIEVQSRFRYTYQYFGIFSTVLYKLVPKRLFLR